MLRKQCSLKMNRVTMVVLVGASLSTMAAEALAQVSPAHRRPQVGQPEFCSSTAVTMKGKDADLSVDMESINCNQDTKGLDKAEVDSVLKDKAGPK
jgi:hypothetical protein